jgi:hypothetical protein
MTISSGRSNVLVSGTMRIDAHVGNQAATSAALPLHTAMIKNTKPPAGEFNIPGEVPRS